MTIYGLDLNPYLKQGMESGIKSLQEGYIGRTAIKPNDGAYLIPGADYSARMFRKNSMTPDKKGDKPILSKGFQDLLYNTLLPDIMNSNKYRGPGPKASIIDKLYQ